MSWKPKTQDKCLDSRENGTDLITPGGNRRNGWCEIARQLRTVNQENNSMPASQAAHKPLSLSSSPKRIAKALPGLYPPHHQTVHFTKVDWSSPSSTTTITATIPTRHDANTGRRGPSRVIQENSRVRLLRQQPAADMRSTFAAAALALACCLDVAHANTEKAIFLGPETVKVPTTPPTIEDLRLDVLTPDDWNKRLKLKASFPSGDSPFGATTWLIITNLTQGQRYELRVCWSATVRRCPIHRYLAFYAYSMQQPTAFTLDVFELPTVWGTPELISSLADDAFSHQSEQVDSGNGDKPWQRRKHEYEASLLFVRVQAAADYFTDNATLMTQVEPVSVDLILDPFLLNALPRSLLPTVGYVVVVAILAWFLSRRILVWIQPVLAAESKSAKRKKRM